VVLEVTARDLESKEIYQTAKFYMVQATDARSNHMVLGPDKKLGLIRDTSIQPFAPKEETFEIPLPAGIKDAVIEVNLSYQPRPGNVYPIHKVVRKVSLER
jgi:hypothetical protein